MRTKADETRISRELNRILKDSWIELTRDIYVRIFGEVINDLEDRRQIKGTTHKQIMEAFARVINHKFNNN